MLTFMRKEGESFYVGEDIEIVITEIENHQVKISVHAPRNMTVLRKELLDNHSAASTREDMAAFISKLKKEQHNA